MAAHAHKKSILGPKENVSLTYEQLEEYIKCAQDNVYFTNHYVKIRPADGGELILFKQRDYQLRVMEDLNTNRFNICLQPRQTGKTETMVAFILHFVLFNKNMTSVILANKENLALDILGRIKLAYENLPQWLKQGVVTLNKGMLEFTNGSRIIAQATSKDAGRGFPISLLYLDEFAHIDANLADEFYTSVYPTVSSGKKTKIIISSTPNGLNLFHKLWKGAVEKLNTFKSTRVDWWEVPGRDELWKQDTIRDIGERKFDQEHGNEFLGSTSTLISGSVLRRLTWRTDFKILEDFGRLGSYVQYEAPILPHVVEGVPQKGHLYLVSVDPSEGQEQDYSSFQVLDITEIPYKQVAKFRNSGVSPLVFPTYVVAAARLYNDAYVLVEINNIGEQVANIIHYDLEYENLVKIQQFGKKGNQVIESGAPTKTSLGLKTSVLTKKIGCSNLKTLIEQDKLLTCDEDTYTELTTFVANKNSYQASREGVDHDDLVMCLVNAAWLFRQDFFRELMEGDVRRMLVREQQIEEDSLLPMPIVDDGQSQERFIDFDGTMWSNVPIEDFNLDNRSSNIRDYKEHYQDFDRKWRQGH